MLCGQTVRQVVTLESCRPCIDRQDEERHEKPNNKESTRERRVTRAGIGKEEKNEERVRGKTICIEYR